VPHRLSLVRLTAALALTLACATPAAAQSTPTARQRALADSIVRVTEQATGGFESMLSTTMGGVAGAAGSEAQAQMQKQMVETMQQFMRKYFPRDSMRAMMADDLASNYAEGELAELLRFYRSDLGTKMLKQTPATMARMQQRMSRVLLEHRDELMQMMMQHAREP